MLLRTGRALISRVYQHHPNPHSPLSPLPLTRLCTLPTPHSLMCSSPYPHSYLPHPYPSRFLSYSSLVFVPFLSLSHFHSVVSIFLSSTQIPHTHSFVPLTCHCYTHSTFWSSIYSCVTKLLVLFYNTNCFRFILLVPLFHPSLSPCPSYLCSLYSIRSLKSVIF